MAEPKEGSIVHVEIHSSDPAQTKVFYNRVFGWEFEDIPEMNYMTFKAPNEPHGGLQKHGEQGPKVLNYILANDISRTLQKVENAGGRIIEAKSEIPGFGWFAIFEEPGGTVQALYQASPRAPLARKPPARRGAKKATKGRKKK